MNFLPIFESIFDIVFGFKGGDLGIVWTSTTGDAWTMSIVCCTGVGAGVGVGVGVGVMTVIVSFLLSGTVPSEW